jgi:hypothetical protein
MAADFGQLTRLAVPGDGGTEADAAGPVGLESSRPD